MDFENQSLLTQNLAITNSWIEYLKDCEFIKIR